MAESPPKPRSSQTVGSGWVHRGHCQEGRISPGPAGTRPEPRLHAHSAAPVPAEGIWQRLPKAARPGHASRSVLATEGARPPTQWPQGLPGAGPGATSVLGPQRRQPAWPQSSPPPLTLTSGGTCPPAVSSRRQPASEILRVGAQTPP